MSYSPDTRYKVTIEGARLSESAKGTLSVNLMLRHPEAGTIFADLWLTEATKERTRKTLASFGFDTDAKIAELIRGNGAGLKGMAADILTKEDSYEGKVRVKVAFVDGPLSTAKEMEPPSAESIAAALALFGAVPAESDEEAVPF